MSDQPLSLSEQNRLKFAALEEQLLACSQVAREIVVDVLRDGSVSTTLATELSALQVSLQAVATQTRRLLGQWPKQR